MQGGDTSVGSVSGGAALKPDIAKQLLNINSASEGGIITQLTSNPFFTAVGMRKLKLTLAHSTLLHFTSILADHYRVSDLPVSELPRRLLVEVFVMVQLSFVAGFWSMSKSTCKMTLTSGFCIG
jgi:hypothetical protein